MPKAISEDLAARKAAKILNRAYRRLKRKSWARVAERYGLSKAKAYEIARGRRRPNPEADRVLMRAILRESDAVRCPRKTLKLIRRIAVPFFARRQRSRRGVYARGGWPVGG